MDETVVIHNFDDVRKPETPCECGEVLVLHADSWHHARWFDHHPPKPFNQSL